MTITCRRHKTTSDVHKEKEKLKAQNFKSHLRFYTKTIEMVIGSAGRDRSCYKIAFCKFEGNGFLDFRSNKSKSGSSVIKSLGLAWLA